MNRDKILENIKKKKSYDFIIIGGGATGLGCALEATSRGYSTLLIEQSDFAKATSSRSTKLIHGGVRYLKQGDFALVSESLKERGLLTKNAPELVKTLHFLVPTYSLWQKFFYGVGLKVYDWVSGAQKLGSTKILNTHKTKELLPTLNHEKLKGSILYQDAQFDDARLSIHLAQTIHNLGGDVINYISAERLLKENGRICGISVKNQETEEKFELKAKAIINATGIFSDQIRKLDNTKAQKRIQTSQGIHIVLPQSFLPGSHALMIPKTRDGRVLFAVPWHDRVIVGTTDTPVDGPTLEPQALEGETRFLLKHIGRYLNKKPTRQDILSVYAGIRPLVANENKKKTSKVSRKHVLTCSSSGLISIMGGKWTTFRKMAEDTIDYAESELRFTKTQSQTRGLQLHQPDQKALENLKNENSVFTEQLHKSFPYTKADVVWTVRKEMARTLEDVLSRRLRTLILDAKASIEIAESVAELMAKELGFDDQWKKQQIKDYNQVAKNYLPIA